jgi:hypothetical protein
MLEVVTLILFFVSTFPLQLYIMGGGGPTQRFPAIPKKYI